MMKTIMTFCLYAVIAVAAQNAIFTRAFGVSRLLRLVETGELALTKFTLLLGAVLMLASPMAFFADRLLAGVAVRPVLRPLVFVLCISIAYILVLMGVGILQFRFPMRGLKEYLAALPGAAFNCCVLGTLLLTSSGGYTMTQSLGFAAGSAAGYGVALLIVSEGQRRIQNRNVPATFRGLPVTLLYIGIISLAIYGFTGHMPAI